MDYESKDDSYGVDDEERKRQRAMIAKRSLAGMEKKYQDQNRKDLEEAERLNAPPMISVPQCHVCQSAHRLWIERRLMKGDAYATIARSLPPEKQEDGTFRTIDRRSVSHHYKEHMPVESAVVRAVLEEEAGLLGQNVEEGVAGAFTMRGALNVLVRKAYDDAMAGITTVEPRDMIQMMKLFNEMDASTNVKAREEAMAAVRIYTDAIKNVLSDMFEKEEADDVQRNIVIEIKRLREIDEIDAAVENNLRVLPRVTG